MTDTFSIETHGTREFNGIMYRLATTFRGHGADDESYAKNEAYMYRKDRGMMARAVRLPNGRWGVYIAERQ